MEVKKIEKLYEEIIKGKEERLIPVKEKVMYLLREGTVEEKRKILHEVNCMLPTDIRVIENRESYICLQFDPERKKLFLYHADEYADISHLDDAASEVLRKLRRNVNNMVAYPKSYDYPTETDDELLYAIAYGFCRAMGQHVSNFAQGEEEINTDRIYSVIAELLIKGVLPKGKEAENVWISQEIGDRPEYYIL